MRLLACLLLCTSCVATTEGLDSKAAPLYPARIQGFLGLVELDGHDYVVDPVVGDSVDTNLDTLPVAGFAISQPLIGRRLQLGFEAGITLAWETDTAVVDTGGGLLVRADNDLWLGDAFVGAKANLPLGPRARLYASAGPLVQYASAELEFESAGTPMRLEDSGVGGGVYARVGFEYEFWPGSHLGLFVRHVESTVDLGRDFDDLDLTGTQIVIAMTELL